MKKRKWIAVLRGFCKGLALFLLAFGLVTQNRSLQIAMVILMVILCTVDTAQEIAEKKKLKNDQQV